MTEQSNAERWPLDYDTLAKGDVIPGDKVEKITKVMRTNAREYQFAVMSLKDRITNDLWEMGREWVLKQEADGLRILTDAEAAEYTDRMLHNHKRGMYRSLRKQTAVDCNELDEEQKEKHLSRLNYNSRIIQGIRVSQRIALTDQHQRQIPGLPKHEKQQVQGTDRDAGRRLATADAQRATGESNERHRPADEGSEREAKENG